MQPYTPSRHPRQADVANYGDRAHITPGFSPQADNGWTRPPYVNPESQQPVKRKQYSQNDSAEATTQDPRPMQGKADEHDVPIYRGSEPSAQQVTEQFLADYHRNEALAADGGEIVHCRAQFPLNNDHVANVSFSK